MKGPTYQVCKILMQRKKRKSKSLNSHKNKWKLGLDRILPNKSRITLCPSQEQVLGKVNCWKAPLVKRPFSQRMNSMNH